MTTATTTQPAEPDLPDIVRLDIKKLEAHPANRPVHDADIRDLTESMKSPIGLLQFPVVVPLPDGGHRIIVGHSRIKSARMLGWKKIPCIVRDDLSSADELIALLGGNDRHRHFTPSQRARIDTELALLPEFTTAKAIATATQRQAPEVTGSLALHRLGTRAHNAADSGQLSLDDAVALEELGKQDPKAVDRVLGKADRGHDLRYAIAEAQRTQRRKEIIAATTRDLTAEGVTVIKRPSGFPHSSKVAPLNRLTTTAGKSIDPDEVRTQSGYAAVLDVDYLLHPQVTYVCVDPERFGHLRIDNYYSSPEDARARAERHAHEAEIRDQLATAAEVRLTWLRQQLATQAKAKAWLDDALCQQAAGEHDLFWPTDTAETLCALPARGGTITAKRATHRFVAVTIGALHELACDPVDHDELARTVASFYDLLTARGYTLTEVEQAEHEECQRLFARHQDTQPGGQDATADDDAESDRNDTPTLTATAGPSAATANS